MADEALVGLRERPLLLHVFNKVKAIVSEVEHQLWIINFSCKNKLIYHIVPSSTNTLINQTTIHSSFLIDYLLVLSRNYMVLGKLSLESY